MEHIDVVKVKRDSEDAPVFVEVEIDGTWHVARVRDVDTYRDELWVFHSFPERYDEGGSETFHASKVRPLDWTPE